MSRVLFRPQWDEHSFKERVVVLVLVILSEMASRMRAVMLNTMVVVLLMRMRLHQW